MSLIKKVKTREVWRLCCSDMKTTASRPSVIERFIQKFSHFPMAVGGGLFILLKNRFVCNVGGRGSFQNIEKKFAGDVPRLEKWTDNVRRRQTHSYVHFKAWMWSRNCCRSFWGPYPAIMLPHYYTIQVKCDFIRKNSSISQWAFRTYFIRKQAKFSPRNILNCSKSAICFVCYTQQR